MRRAIHIWRSRCNGEIVFIQENNYIFITTDNRLSTYFPIRHAEIHFLKADFSLCRLLFKECERTLANTEQHKGVMAILDCRWRSSSR